jgi:hypothetical protein
LPRPYQCGASSFASALSSAGLVIHDPVGNASDDGAGRRPRQPHLMPALLHPERDAGTLGKMHRQGNGKTFTRL